MLTSVPFTTDASGRMRTRTDNPTAAMTCAVRHLARWQPRPNWLCQLVVGWSRLASALPCLADRSGPWSRRTGAPQASAAGRDRNLGPRWVRGAPGSQGHGWSPAVTSGHEEAQVGGRLTHAARTTPTGGSDCGPEGRGSSPLGHPTAARGTASSMQQRSRSGSLSHRGRNQRRGGGQPSSRVMAPGLVPRR
jgi:hypothetical protein